MKITNNGKKIVHIGTNALMPGGEITVADKLTETPAIQILVKHGVLTLTSDTEAKKETAKASKKEAVTVAEVTETETTTKKASSKSTSKAASTEQ